MLPLYMNITRGTMLDLEQFACNMLYGKIANAQSSSSICEGINCLIRGNNLESAVD